MNLEKNSNYFETFASFRCENLLHFLVVHLNNDKYLLDCKAILKTSRKTFVRLINSGIER